MKQTKSEKIGTAYQIIGIQKEQITIIEKRIRDLENEKWELIESIANLRASVKKLEDVK